MTAGLSLVGEAPKDTTCDVSWWLARSTAYAVARPLPARARPLADAGDMVLAEPVRAQTALPPHDAAAMDGWAVAGDGPWQVVREVLAGHDVGDPLDEGTAVVITTGAPVPTGTRAVLRREDGVTADGRLHPAAGVTLKDRRHVRPAGEEAQVGEELLPAGHRLNPVALGLAAAAGYDELWVQPRPVVQPLVLGDELLTSGLPHHGLIRDSLGPQLPGWLQALGADSFAPKRLPDRRDVLRDAFAQAAASTEPVDVLVTTGGSAAGPTDHVHGVVRDLGGTFLVDGVRVRPGHPMGLARLPGDLWLVVLPGNPFAACAALLTLLHPLLRRLQGLTEPVADRARLSTTVTTRDCRLLPVTVTDGVAAPLAHAGPGMLRGLAVADALAVVPSGGANADAEVDLLHLPWPSPG